MEGTFGAHLRDLRKAKGLTQRQLAAQLGLSHTFLSKIENNRPGHRPSEVVILSMAKALDADPAGLVLLADKIPTEAREAMARSPSARKLLRRAEGLTESEWREVLRSVPRRAPSARSRMLIDATDLELWAPRRDAQSVLPQLVRALVLATTRGVSAVAFRSGDGVALPGWDGTVTIEVGNAFVPAGVSGWELSTEERIKTKADEDYGTRTGDPRGIQPSGAAFVFVTPRRWRDKLSWAKEREAEGVWQRVRALDADDLETWLELAPSVHAWISRILGKLPDGTVDLGGFWLDCLGSSTPPLTAEIVTAGRESTVERIHQWVRQPSGSIAIQAGSRDEALAVFAAAVHLLPAEERDTALSRAMVVDSSSAWRTLTTVAEPLILIARFELREELGAALRAGHAVVLPLGPADNPSPSAVVVPRTSREAVSKAFVATGVPEQKARELGGLARASFKSLLRRLSMRPEIQHPAWANPVEGVALARLMLAGAWSEASDGDRRIIEALTQLPYAHTRGLAIRWSNDSDAPVKKVKDSWFFVSKDDAWSLLARYLTDDDLGRFRDATLQVLGTPDPEFEVPDEKRWMSRVLGHVPEYSEHLIEGMSDTLAIAGARGAPMTVQGVSAEDHAMRIVRDLLDRANGDWRIWASLSKQLRLLAEAAPDAFLTGVEVGTAGIQPALREMFRDKESGFFGSSPHVGLLWALEMLAWSPDFLGRASTALAGLARLDPGGSTSNRPRNSLAQAFLPWLPQTAAPLEQRFHALDAVMRREPEEGWRLLVMILPDAHGFAMSAPRPRYRDWAPDPMPPVKTTEYLAAIHGTVARTLDHVGIKASRWVDLIEALPNLPAVDHELVVARLSEIEVARLEDPGPGAIWDALRRLIARHRSFADAQWALPPDRVERLAQILPRFEPADAVTRYGWLFGRNPEVAERRDHDWDAHEKAVEDLRMEAIQDVHARGGIAGLEEFAKAVEYPGKVGFTLGRSSLLEDEEAEFLGLRLANDDSSLSLFARSFAGGRYQTRGQKWLEELLDKSGAAWRPAQRGEVLICLPCDGHTWDLAKAAGPEAENHYWNHLTPFFVPAESDVVLAVRKFLQVGRSDAAIGLAARDVRGPRIVPSGFTVEILEEFLKNPPASDIDVPFLAHNVGELLSNLEPSTETSEERIASLEWAFLSMLRYEHQRPRFLHRKLAADPSFFVELLTLAYRAEGEAPKGLSEKDQQGALHGHELLESWRTLPGTARPGSIDSEDLLRWVRAARTATSDVGRGAIGDQMIGQMLSGSPVGEDGVWPHEAVRDVIEEIASVEVENGLEIGLYNSRGVVSKDPRDGGKQERKLSQDYRTAGGSIVSRWPRTGAMLQRISSNYDRDARRQDEEAELREDVFG